ncbi:hypothetical protein J3E69DRAFT_58209 [Trichoderma sp. SZMC 28015]
MGAPFDKAGSSLTLKRSGRVLTSPRPCVRRLTPWDDQQVCVSTPAQFLIHLLAPLVLHFLQVALLPLFLFFHCIRRLVCWCEEETPLRPFLVASVFVFIFAFLTKTGSSLTFRSRDLCWRKCPVDVVSMEWQVW